jgi:hypothetical protein
MEEGSSAFKILTSKSTEKGPSVRRRWGENSIMDLEGYVSIRGTGLVRLRIGIIREPL